MLCLAVGKPSITADKLPYMQKLNEPCAKFVGSPKYNYVDKVLFYFSFTYINTADYDDSKVRIDNH